MFFAPSLSRSCFLVRFFVHIVPFVLTLIYQFVFSDFINVPTTVYLYSICAAALFLDSIYLFFPRFLEERWAIVLGFLFDACMLASFIFFLGIPGLFLSLILSLFIIFACSVYKNHLYLLSYILFLGGLFSLALAWGYEENFDSRMLISILIYLTLLLYFLIAEVISSLVVDSKNKTVRASQNQALDSDLYNKPLVCRLEEANRASQSLFSKINSENLQSKKASYEHHLNMIQNFLSKLRFILEKPQPEFSQFDVNTSIKQAWKDLNYSSFSGEIKFQLNSSGLIFGSPQHIKKAVQEILINSVESIPAQGGEIVCSTSLEPSYLVIAFRDNGKGMEKRELKELFKPSFSRKLGLRGLGLLYIRTVVEIHQGQIEIKNNLNKGLSVRVKLPLKIKTNKTYLTA